MLEEKQQLMVEFKNYPTAELTFMGDAFFTLNYCHRVLKWTYVFAYYRQKYFTKT